MKLIGVVYIQAHILLTVWVAPMRRFRGGEKPGENKLQRRHFFTSTVIEENLVAVFFSRHFFTSTVTEENLVAVFFSFKCSLRPNGTVWPNSDVTIVISGSKTPFEQIMRRFEDPFCGRALGCLERWSVGPLGVTTKR